MTKLVNLSKVLFLFFFLLQISPVHSQGLWGLGYFSDNDSIAVFKVSVSGTGVEKVKTFDAIYEPEGGLASDGKEYVYGMFKRGGLYGRGFIYRINVVDYTYEVLANLYYDNYSGNMIYIDSLLYLNAYSSNNYSQLILCFNTSDLTLDTLDVDAGGYVEHSFGKGINNNLLGAANGQIFEYKPLQDDFQYLGPLPSMWGYGLGGFMQCENEDIFFLCRWCGYMEQGSLTKYSAGSGQVNQVVQFDENVGAAVSHTLIEIPEQQVMGVSGNLYTYGGQNGFQVVHSFNDPEIGHAWNDLAISNNGLAYGTTYNQATNGNGCVYSLDLNSLHIEKIYDFQEITGWQPTFARLAIVNDTIYAAIPDEKRKIEVAIGPNPFSENIRISFHSPYELPALVRVIDLNGYEVYSTTKCNDQNLKLDLSFLASGIYIVQLVSEDYIENRKIIKH